MSMFLSKVYFLVSRSDNCNVGNGAGQGLKVVSASWSAALAWSLLLLLRAATPSNWCFYSNLRCLKYTTFCYKPPTWWVPQAMRKGWSSFMFSIWPGRFFCICLSTNKYQKHKSVELGDQLHLTVLSFLAENVENYIVWPDSWARLWGQLWSH